MESTMGTIESAVKERSSTIYRDLKLNFNRVFGESALAPDEAALSLLAIATSLADRPFAEFASARLRSLGVSEDLIQEAAESAAIMGMLNTYYRFRHIISHGQGDGVAESYKMAGLRMTSLARPQMGKERFEMLAFAVSVLNGCESCINAHEKELRGSGISTEKIHDLARLAAIVKGLTTLNAIA